MSVERVLYLSEYQEAEVRFGGHMGEELFSTPWVEWRPLGPWVQWGF